MKTTLALWAFPPSAFTGLGWLFGRLVCAWTGSPWCHVGVSLHGIYYEADPFQGVVGGEVPDEACCIRVWTVHDRSIAERWINRQLGKAYDWPGILGFVIGRSESGRRDRGHWFCSELATVILRKFGVEVCGETPAWEIDPGEMVKGAGREATRRSPSPRGFARAHVTFPAVVAHKFQPLKRKKHDK
jgi:hypothetical protein